MEITANVVQTVQSNQNVLFTDYVVCGNGPMIHRAGSGLVTLKGVTSQCRARFRASFGANIAIPTGGEVGPISLAIAIEGEPIGPTTMIITPAAVENFFNVSSDIFIDVPKGCCMTIGVRNITDQAVLVQNANLIIERVA